MILRTRARVAVLLLASLPLPARADEGGGPPVVVVSTSPGVEPEDRPPLRVFIQALVAPRRLAMLPTGALAGPRPPGQPALLELPPPVGEAFPDALARALRARGLESEGIWIQALGGPGELRSVAVRRLQTIDGGVRVREGVLLSGPRLARLLDEPLAEDFSFVPPLFAVVASALAELRGGGWRELDVAVAVLESDRLAASERRAEASARALAYRFEGESEPLRIVAQCLDARGDRETSVEFWRRAVTASPESSLCRLGLASALAALREPVEAVAAFEEVLRLVRARAEASPADAILERRAAEALDDLRGLARRETRRLAAWETARVEVRRALAEEARSSSAAEGALRAARERLDSDPAALEARVELGEQQQARGLYSAATESYERALAIDPRSRLALERLARLQILGGSHVRAVATLGDAPGDPALLVLLGDALMAGSGSGWRPQRWSEYSAGFLSLQTKSYSLVAPAAGALARLAWERAGKVYREASERFPDDARARARYADWLLHDDPRAPAAALSLEGADDYADLYRVEACRLERRGGDAGAVARLMNRFLEHAAERPLDCLRVVRRWLSSPEAGALDRATRLCQEAIERFPFHAGLRECRADLALRRSRLGGEDAAGIDRESAAADLRYALSTGDEAWQAIEKAWRNPPVGQRGPHPPFSPPGPASAANPLGAPRSFPEFLRLRCELAAVLLGADRAWEAFAELRPLDAFLEKEKRRLRGTRRREPGGGTGGSAEADRTRPDSWRDEPVDFGNVRERLLWSRLSLWMGHALRGLEDREAARERYRWAARSLAVREGVVLEESRWEHELSPGARELASEALAGFALVSLQAGPANEARAFLPWIRRLGGGASETLEELERELGDAERASAARGGQDRENRKDES